jgi:DNA-binding transcriptional LysR family regulator
LGLINPAKEICERAHRAGALVLIDGAQSIPHSRRAHRTPIPIGDVSGQDFVMYERTYAPGFYDLIFGILRDARIVPNVSQTAAEISTMISLVIAHMGIAILPASAMKHALLR